MFTKWIPLSCLLFVALLSGCAQHNTAYDVQEFSKGKKAVVIFKAAVSLTSNFCVFLSHNSSSYLVLTWKDDTSHEKFSNQKIVLFPWANSVTYDVMQIQPGTYYLESCQYSGEGYVKTYTPQKNLITFTIRPGEALYLGDIYLDDINSKGHFEFTESFPAAQEYIKVNHPGLSLRLQKNIVRPIIQDPELIAAMHKAVREYSKKKSGA